VTSKHPNVETRDRAEVDRKIIQVQGKQSRGRKITQSRSRNGELVLQGRRRKSRDSKVKGTRPEEDR